ncbi:ATP-binding protein [bacterium]|nr:ATP-binding protein [bacterium]
MFTPFGKKLDELSFKDIQNFCEKSVPENIYLDYKEEINPKNDHLAKTIASFANTYGGWILIGVKEKTTAQILHLKV